MKLYQIQIIVDELKHAQLAIFQRLGTMAPAVFVHLDREGWEAAVDHYVHPEHPTRMHVREIPLLNNITLRPEVY